MNPFYASRVLFLVLVFSCDTLATSSRKRLLSAPLEGFIGGSDSAAVPKQIPATLSVQNDSTLPLCRPVEALDPFSIQNRAGDHASTLRTWFIEHGGIPRLEAAEKHGLCHNAYGLYFPDEWDFQSAVSRQLLEACIMDNTDKRFVEFDHDLTATTKI